MAQLAIFGHTTRGNEVIALLEMLGGVNTAPLRGDITELVYYIDVDKSICCINIEFEYRTEFYKITIEEFKEKYPYKVGDKVIYEDKRREITKMVWEEQTNTVAYKLDDKLYCNVINELQPYKEETIDRKYDVEEYLKVWKETEKGLEVVVNDKFELKEDSGKFYIIKKQLQYPKTYEECCQHLGCNDKLNAGKLVLFQQLINARNAYWKITGEQMGLGKSWEPDWNNGELKYCINIINNVIVRQKFCGDNHILAFPTEEMRDAFYENFKDLIEKCKEFL